MGEAHVTVDDLVEVSRRRAQVEAAEWSYIVKFRDAELARLARVESPMKRMIEQSTIAAEIGQAVGLSEGQVIQKLASADRLLGFAPLTWLAFQAGDIDGLRAREIASTLGKLERLESKQRLDGTVVAYASTHTVAELRVWLKRFVTRTEPDLSIERANAEREKRHVEITMVDDGMAWLNAYLPAHQAAAIKTRLRREVKQLGSGDERTLEQRRADILVDHLLHAPASDGTVGGLKIDIAVTLDALVLTSLEHGYAESPDGSWEVPADWIMDSALVGDSFWHRLLVDPIVGDTLAHEYVGYATPDVLRRAIIFRDGVCATPGCLHPAAESDMDHRQPWPEGPTSGVNLNPRCRADHARKGHGTLHRILHAEHARRSGATRARYRQPLHETSAMETTLAWATVDQTT